MPKLAWWKSPTKSISKSNFLKVRRRLRFLQAYLTKSDEFSAIKLS